jgi:hypothetical protein
MPENPIENFDYRVGCDDFLLYELGRLIEEDRASFDDEDFRRMIEAGVHEHIERRVDIRAQMARRFRSSGGRLDRTVRAIENIESTLQDIPEILQSYTAYIFARLESCAETPPDQRITGAAEALLETPGDRAQEEASIDLLGSIRSAVSARVLAFAVSEPMLDEDLEAKAYQCLRSLWPLSRPYILYSLKPHTHEDLPFRWFQLLIDCDEPTSVDRILEELLVHGGDADFREDLAALIPLLDKARDPETEDKILQVLNSEVTPKPAAGLLQDYLKNSKTPKERAAGNNPWTNLERAYAANRRYCAAAKLFDEGQKAAAAKALDDLLKEDSEYPLALMLKEML